MSEWTLPISPHTFLWLQLLILWWTQIHVSSWSLTSKPQITYMHLATEYHNLDSSQASQTQNIQNKIVFFNLPPQTSFSSSYVHYSSKWCCPHIVASQKPESYPRLLLLTHLHPIHHLTHLLLLSHFISWLFIVQPPLTFMLLYMLFFLSTISFLPLSTLSLNPRTNVCPKYHLLSKVSPIVPSAYRRLSY